MKRLITNILIFGIVATTMAVAQNSAPQWSSDCEYTASMLNLPAHYCACTEGSSQFQFPLDSVISDTVWFTATVNDLRQGFSAYWFADCSVTMEVYAFCTSKVPTISLMVSANHMRELDAKEINRRMEEMSETAKLMAETLTPHMRVYPNNGGSGRVYCYPYDQGPLSTCEDPLPLRPRMVYVCDKEENAYRMEANMIPSSGKAFVHWKQLENRPCEVWLTLDSCAGEEIGRVTLTDSLHVFQPNAQRLIEARSSERPIWLHVKHGSAMVGRITWYNNPVYAEPLAPVRQELCSGKTATYDSRTYTTDTAFTDTIWVGRDTLTTREVNLVFTPPVEEHDTIYTTQVDLNRGYLYTPTGDVFHAFGEYDLWVVKAGMCTRHIVVTVLDQNNMNHGLETAPNETQRVAKMLQNGHVVIILNENKYNLLGEKIN